MLEIIVIAEQSHIVREGLASVIRLYKLSQQLVLVDNVEDLKNIFENDKVELIIINPNFLNSYKLKAFKRRMNIPDTTIFIGLIYHFYEPQLLKLFADLIFVTDNEDTVIGKLQKLYKQNKLDVTGDSHLTNREKEVLRLLLQGLSNKEVAYKLFISPHTVIAHRKNIVEKTGIRSLSGLAVYAITHNISDINDIKQ